MARKTHFEKDQIIAKLASENDALRHKVAQLTGDLERSKNAEAAPANGDCLRCGGSGQYMHYGECKRCEGTGRDPGVEEGRAKYRFRHGVQPARPTNVMRELAAAYCAEHGVASCTPDEVRSWAASR